MNFIHFFFSLLFVSFLPLFLLLFMATMRERRWPRAAAKATDIGNKTTTNKKRDYKNKKNGKKTKHRKRVVPLPLPPYPPPHPPTPFLPSLFSLFSLLIRHRRCACVRVCVFFWGAHGFDQKKRKKEKKKQRVCLRVFVLVVGGAWWRHSFRPFTPPPPRSPHPPQSREAILSVSKTT